MSDDQTPQGTSQPAATAVVEAPSASPEAAAPEKAVEKPFTTDVLQSCTARMTRKAWDLYLKYLKPIEQIRTLPVRAQLTARDEAGATKLQELLKEAGVTQLTRKGIDLHFTATFESIQTVIKLPETYMLDATRI